MFFLLVAPPARVPVDQAKGALWWMRMAATKTLLLGLGLFYWSYMHMKVGEGTGRARYVMYGMMIGIVMWGLLWFVIWPAQKKILAAREAGGPPPESAVKRGATCSLVNGLLAGPMLMLMVFAHNYGTFSYGMLGLITVIGVVAMGATVLVGKAVSHQQT
jgi:uncharacterized membrane protein